jgi:hypothetical protein
MRAFALALIGGVLAAPLPARAYDAPAIVIPGRIGVPVVINGGDASFCIVEGDWGLARPGHVPPTIVYCPPVDHVLENSGRFYYPAQGKRPGYGRFEVEPPPNRRLPPPAPSYYREWGAQSESQPATIDPPTNIDINVDAQVDWRRRRPRRPPRN